MKKQAVYQPMIAPQPDPTTGRLCAIINFDDEEIRPERRVFNINTYNRFKDNREVWHKIEQVNEILSTLDNDEKAYVVKLFVRAKRDLAQIHDGDSAIAAITAIDEKVSKVFGKLNLSERILDYVKQNQRIILPDLSKIGSRPQDSEAMSFRESDYHQIHAIFVIAKMLFPIFGEIISRIQRVDKLDNSIKEILAFGIMNSLLNRDFHEITNKLQFYIGVIIKNTISDDQMMSFYGLTEIGLTHDRLAKTIVKNAVNFDLYQDDGNVMRYITVTIKRFIANSTSKNMTYKALMVPEVNDTDGSNASIMENESHALREPLEVPIVVKLGVEKFISDYIAMNNLSTDLMEKSISYYTVTTLPPTMINELLVAMFVGDTIGSAYSVRYMNMEMIVKIVTITQIYCIYMGFESLVPLLSLIPAGAIKTHADEIDNHIIINDGRIGTVNYYINLAEETKHLDDFPGFNLAEYLKQITMFIVSQVHNYNVSPSIEALCNGFGDTKNVDGTVRYGKGIVNELHRFMYHLMVDNHLRMIIKASV